MKITLKTFCCSLVFVFGVTFQAMQAQTSSVKPNVAPANAQTEKGADLKKEDGNVANLPPLSEAQVNALKAIKVESEKKAAPAALHFAGVMRQVYENMLADKPDAELRTKLDAEMKEGIWGLLLIKGQSMFDAVAVLTPEQKRILKAEMMKPGAPADMMELIEKTFKIPAQ